MTTVKTAIYLDEVLLQEAKALARAMKISRSRLIAQALAEFIQRRRTEHLIDRINAAVSDVSDPAEEQILHFMNRHQRRVLRKG